MMDAAYHAERVWEQMREEHEAMTHPLAADLRRYSELIPAHPMHAAMLKAAAELDRLTREIGEALKSAEHHREMHAVRHNALLDEMVRHEKTQAALSAAREEAERFKKLDREAATHVESLICVRTHFTGEPPYVGWKGLGLALREALDAGDAARAELASVKYSASDHEISLGIIEELRAELAECRNRALEEAEATARVHSWPLGAYINDDTQRGYVLACKTIGDLFRALKEAPHE